MYKFSASIPLVTMSIGLGALFSACSGPCDTTALANATNAQDIFESCQTPDNLTEQWSCSTQIPGDNTISALTSLHRDCNLDALGSEQAFATGTGDPRRGAALYDWMKRNNVENAAAYARIVVGNARFTQEITWPAMPGVAPTEKLGPGPTVVEPRVGVGPYQPLHGWGIGPSAEGKTLYIDGQLNIGTLRHAMAQAAKPGETVYLVGKSDVLTQFPLRVSHRQPSSPIVTIHPDGSMTSNGNVIQPNEFSGDAVTLSIADGAPVSLLAKHLGAWSDRTVSLAFSHRPCGNAPTGMLCIDGDHNSPTFYIDEKPSDTYDECVKSGICRSEKGTWASARETCSSRGKRLPTAQELKRARVHLPKNEYPEQWTASWHGQSNSPLGPCDGAPRCANSQRSTSAEKGRTPSQTLSSTLRCASTNAWLATTPPAIIQKPRSAGAIQENVALAKLANAVTADNLTDKGICGDDVRANWPESLKKGGRSSPECRDPYSYVTSNEPRRNVWAPYFRNLGGAYVGVGSDQSYDFIANAKSEWAWVFDYDPNVVRLHQMMKILVENSPTIDELLARFSEDNKASSLTLIRTSPHFDEKTRRILQDFFSIYRRKLEKHYRDSHERPIATGFGWLSTEENYSHIHTLYKLQRIVPIGADMLGTKAMQSIGTQARKMGIVVRVFYVSNAPTAWGGQVTDEWRKNVAALPFDEETVVLTTFNWGGFDQIGYWHYNVMHGHLFQRRMALPGYATNSHDGGPAWDRIPSPDPDLTLSGLPGLGPF